MGALINNESDCFHYLLYKNVIFPENIYVINMSEDTPECTKLHNLKKMFFGGTYITNPHSNYCIATTPILSKIIPPFLNMDLRSCTCKSLELCRKWD